MSGGGGELELLRELTEVPDEAVLSLRRSVLARAAAGRRRGLLWRWLAVPALASAAAAAMLLMMAGWREELTQQSQPLRQPDVPGPASPAHPLPIPVPPLRRMQESARRLPPPPGAAAAAAAKEKKAAGVSLVVRLETADPDVVIYVVGAASSSTTSGGEL